MNPLIAIIGLVAVVAAALIFIGNNQAFATPKDLNVATGGIDNAIPEAGQQPLVTIPQAGLQGIQDGRQDVTSAIEAQLAILTGNQLVGEDAIRAIDAKVNNVIREQTENTGTSGGTVIIPQTPNNVNTQPQQSQTSVNTNPAAQPTGLINYTDAKKFASRDLTGRVNPTQVDLVKQLYGIKTRSTLTKKAGKSAGVEQKLNTYILGNGRTIKSTPDAVRRLAGNLKTDYQQVF